MSNKLSLSIMCADPLNLGQAIQEMEQAGTDLIHVDIMDGNFVDNLTFGIDQLAAFASHSSIPVEAHLMVNNIGAVLPSVLKTGCSHVSFHIETTSLPVRYLSMIHSAGKRAGIAVNPSTPVDFIENIADYLDYVLIMTVEPGFAGQKFISGCAKKVKRVRQMIGPDKDLVVDGNISPENALLCEKMGANVFVLGTSGAYVSRHLDLNRLEQVRKSVGSMKEGA